MKDKHNQSLEPIMSHRSTLPGTGIFTKKLWVYALAGLLIFGITSCSPQRRLAKRHAKEAKAAQIAHSIAELNTLLHDEGRIPIEEKEQRFQVVQDLKLDDKEVVRLIPLVEEKLRSERTRLEQLRRQQQEEELRLQAEEARKREQQQQQRTVHDRRILDALAAVANAPDLRTANNSIANALTLFASENVPVLLLISREGEIRDYDRPTTIRRYLELLKDQRRFNEEVENVKYDANGKITELELRKRF